MATVDRMEAGEISASYTFTEIHFMTPKPKKYVDPFGFASSFGPEVRRRECSFFTSSPLCYLEVCAIEFGKMLSRA